MSQRSPHASAAVTSGDLIAVGVSAAVRRVDLHSAENIHIEGGFRSFEAERAVERRASMRGGQRAVAVPDDDRAMLKMQRDDRLVFADNGRVVAGGDAADALWLSE